MANGISREWFGVNKLLLSFIVLLLGSLWAIAWGAIQTNRQGVSELKSVVPVVETQYKDILRRLDSIEDLLKPRR